MNFFLAAKVTCFHCVNDEQRGNYRLAIFEETIEWPDDEQRQHYRIEELHVGTDVAGDVPINEQRQRNDEEGQKPEAEQRADDAHIGQEEVFAEVGNETVLPHQRERTAG